MGRYRLFALAAAALFAGCASLPAGPPPEPALPDPAPGRSADDEAFAAAKSSLAPLDGHYVGVAGGRILGGTMLPEDTARLLREGARGAGHAYFFTLGTEGDRTESLPALYSSRVAGGGLLEALGLKAVMDPEAGTLTLARGGAERTFPFRNGAAAATLTLEPASGLGSAREVTFVVSTGFAGTAVVSGGDAEAMGLALSEIPGEVALTDTLTGKTLPCRRALVRVTLERMDNDPARRASAVVEVLFPR